MENIIEEAELLASKGCREIILIAQDVTEYGTDIYGRLMLPELLRKLCRVDGIRWIRLMYCYEDKITDELIEVMASEEKICDYIDIPLQHVSDGVLSAMNRHSTTESIKDTLGRLRTAMPDIHISEQEHDDKHRYRENSSHRKFIRQIHIIPPSFLQDHSRMRLLSLPAPCLPAQVLHLL